ncbi:hypothetical protein DFH09DRAFT_1193538 [Mycena vulgaris]|nr:hypothetical protein DFH09DRAFT_1193538 [Mycena vulgaris]
MSIAGSWKANLLANLLADLVANLSWTVVSGTPSPWMVNVISTLYLVFVLQALTVRAVELGLIGSCLPVRIMHSPSIKGLASLSWFLKRVHSLGALRSIVASGSVLRACGDAQKKASNLNRRR